MRLKALAFRRSPLGRQDRREEGELEKLESRPNIIFLSLCDLLSPLILSFSPPEMEAPGRQGPPTGCFSDVSNHL